MNCPHYQVIVSDRCYRPQCNVIVSVLQILVDMEEGLGKVGDLGYGDYWSPELATENSADRIRGTNGVPATFKMFPHASNGTTSLQ